MLVFVYGRLAKGGAWHHLIQGSRCEFNQALTERRFIRDEIGATADESGECLSGQVYNIGGALTYKLDRVEKPLIRELEWVYLKEKEVSRKALVYVYKYKK